MEQDKIKCEICNKVKDIDRFLSNLKDKTKKIKICKACFMLIVTANYPRQLGGNL